MKTLLSLFFLVANFITCVVASNPLVKTVYVNGIPQQLNKSKISVLNDEHVLISLVSLPKGYHYQYVFTGSKAAIWVDSSHLRLFSFKKGAHNLKIAVVPQHPAYQVDQIEITVNNAFLKSKLLIPVFFCYLIVILFASLISIRFIMNRNRSRVQELRNDWTNQLHNDIGGDLSSVALRLEVLQKKLDNIDPKIFDNLNKIFGILTDIQRKLRFVFNLVDPKQDSLQVMLKGIHDFAQDNCQIQNIKLIYNNEIQNVDESIKIDVGRINKLYLVLKEALNNIFNRAKAKNVFLNIKKQKEGIWIEVKDDGVGFDLNMPHKGNGIRNLRQYAKEGFMDLNIQSELGKGTCITTLVHLV